MGYLDIDITAKYGDQLLSIIEKMTNGEVSILMQTSDDTHIKITKDEFVNVCKELKQSSD